MSAQKFGPEKYKTNRLNKKNYRPNGVIRRQNRPNASSEILRDIGRKLPTTNRKSYVAYQMLLLYTCSLATVDEISTDYARRTVSLS